MSDNSQLDAIEDAVDNRINKLYLIQRSCLPICMVDAAGKWVRPIRYGNTESGRPIYRSIDGFRPAFLGYDWEPLHVECRVEDLGNGLFVIS